MAGKGFNKELTCSAELREFTGEKKISRGQLMKAIWKHIKKHDLQNPENKREIVPDKKLATLIGSKPINMFKMPGKLSEHLS